MEGVGRSRYGWHPLGVGDSIYTYKTVVEMRWWHVGGRREVVVVVVVWWEGRQREDTAMLYYTMLYMEECKMPVLGRGKVPVPEVCQVCSREMGREGGKGGGKGKGKERCVNKPSFLTR